MKQGMHETVSQFAERVGYQLMELQTTFPGAIPQCDEEIKRGRLYGSLKLLPVPIKDWKRYVDDVFSIIPKGNRVILLQYLNSIDPHIKFTIEQPNAEGGIPFLDTFPQTQR